MKDPTVQKTHASACSPCKVTRSRIKITNPRRGLLSHAQSRPPHCGLSDEVWQSHSLFGCIKCM